LVLACECPARQLVVLGIQRTMQRPRWTTGKVLTHIGKANSTRVRTKWIWELASALANVR
jgi:hypothetical protein